MHPERARHILAAVAQLAEVRRTRAAAARQLGDRHCFIPQTPHPKQRQFLALTCREALFGGSAGPGKSSALLMAALAHVDQPKYAALLIRRTYRDLALPGALMDRAGEWLRPTAARWNAIDKQWRFPSGATLSFGHLDNENDKYRYQGSELNFCVAKGTPVRMADGSWQPIETLRVGDRVATLEGPRPITRTHAVGVKKIVRVTTPYGYTDMSETHRVAVMGPDGPRWAAPLSLRPTQSGEICTNCEGSGRPSASWPMPPGWIPKGLRPARAPGQRPRRANPFQGFFAWSAGGRNSGAACHATRRAARPLPGWCVLAMLYVPRRPRSKTENCPRADAARYDPLGSSPAGSATDYHPFFDSCGAPQGPGLGVSPKSIQPQCDAAARFQQNAVDDAGSIPKCSQNGTGRLAHPYTNAPLGPLHETVAHQALARPAGVAECFDLTVASSSHYITWGELIGVNCGFDELTQFTESQYTYLLSRIRRPAGSNLPLMCRSASNPGGTGHAWVKRRFVDEGGPDDRIFIPARLDDNPSLDTAEYEDSLRGLDPITYRQLRDGEWVTDAGALIYPFESHHMAAAAPPLPDVVLGMDLGSSMSKPTTAITAIGSTPAEPVAYVLESEARACLSPTDSAEFLRELYDRHAPMAVVVDPGGMGQAYVDEFQKRHNLPCQPAIRRNKLAYRRYFRGDLAHHKLRVVEPACRLLLDEAAQLRWDEREIDCEKGATDHRTDSMIFAYAWLWHYLHEPKQAGHPRGSPEEIEEAIEAEQDAEAERIAQRRARRYR